MSAPKWMRLKDYCKYSGIPESVMNAALHGPYKNQIGRKLHPEKNYNSPWMIDREKTDELFRIRAI